MGTLGGLALVAPESPPVGDLPVCAVRTAESGIFQLKVVSTTAPMNTILLPTRPLVVFVQHSSCRASPGPAVFTMGVQEKNPCVCFVQYRSKC